MKTIIATIAAVSLLVLGTMAFAHTPGGWGSGHMGPGYGGHMMGQGYGGQMMGQGYGGQMMGGDARGGLNADQEFLDKTVDLRKALHEKKFEYREAVRDPETTNNELTKIDKEVFDLQAKIREKAPRSAYGGYGSCL
jgi:hypothetical protein